MSGFINANTTWNLAGSPYIVEGNALLSHGYTLTIDPGVVVKFNDSCALQIDGELHAIGTAANRITFTSNQVNPAPGDWAKIHFADTSANAVFDAQGNYLSGCIMKYCDVVYGGELGFGEIHVEAGSPYFSHCRIHDSAASGLYYDGLKAIVDSSSIRNCAENGIFLNTGHYLMYNDSITNNTSRGILMQQEYDGLQSKVLNCYFAFNNTAIGGIYNGIHHTTISNNYFINNSGPVVSPDGHYDTLLCNKFINNYNGPAISFGSSCCTINGGLVFNNLFDGNNNPNGPSVIEAGAGYPSGYGDTLIFANNLVRNNSSVGNSCCRFSAYLFNFTSVEFLRIYDNIFKNNLGLSLIQMQGQQNSNAQYDFLYMKNNTFSNPSCQYELYNSVPYGSPDLYLDNNYWGSTSTQHIDSVIYDYFNYANLSVVYYSPILTSPVVIDTTCPGIGEPTGIVNNTANNEYTNIFPNPFVTTATILFDKEVHNATFTLYNLLGEKVETISGINGESVQVDRGNLKSGIYFYEVIEKGNRIVRGKAVIY